MGLGSSLPPVELVRKLSVYFLLRTRRRCWQHWTQVLAALDAALVRPVRCLTLARVSRAHRMLAPDTGRILFARPCCVMLASARELFLTEEHRTLRVHPVARVWWPCEFAVLSAHGFGVHQMHPVWSSRASGVAGAGARMLAVGGNGRVQMASLTWPFLEHRMHCSSVRWLPAVGLVLTTFAQ